MVVGRGAGAARCAGPNALCKPQEEGIFLSFGRLYLHLVVCCLWPRVVKIHGPETNAAWHAAPNLCAAAFRPSTRQPPHLVQDQERRCGRKVQVRPASPVVGGQLSCHRSLLNRTFAIDDGTSGAGAYAWYVDNASDKVVLLGYCMHAASEHSSCGIRCCLAGIVGKSACRTASPSAAAGAPANATARRRSSTLMNISRRVSFGQWNKKMQAGMCSSLHRSCCKTCSA